jgi:hypothetical protein
MNRFSRSNVTLFGVRMERDVENRWPRILLQYHFSVISLSRLVDSHAIGVICNVVTLFSDYFFLVIFLFIHARLCRVVGCSLRMHQSL